MILYHGSYSNFEKIDLSKGRKFKDLNHQISFHTEKGIFLLNKVRHYEVK